MAGNARFHDKQHRKNHHTIPTIGYPDSGTDPIASIDEPFQGDFVINGRLSASSGIDILSAHVAGDVDCENLTVRGTTFTNFISSDSTETIISDGSLIGNGDFTLTMDFRSGIYATSPRFNISQDLSAKGNTILNKELTVVGNSNLSSVNSNNKIYLDYPTNTLIDSSVSNARITVRNTDGESINIIESSNNVNVGSKIQNFRSRGTLNTKTAVSANDLIFSIRGVAHNGINYNGDGYGGVAAINAYADGDQTSLNGGGYLTFSTNPSSNVNNLQERLRITESGNVGIGTTTPFEKLHVDGNVYATGNIYVAGNLSAMGEISYIDTTVLGTSAITVENHSILPAISAKQINGSTIAIFNDGTEDVAKIDSNGLSAKNGFFKNKIGIGTSNPTFTLDVNGNIRGVSAQGALVASNGSGNGQTSIYLTRENGNTNRKTWELIQYSESGSVESGGFAIRTISDNYLSSGNCFVATRADTGHQINSISLNTNSNTRFHINSSGNIGINDVNFIPDFYGKTTVHVYDAIYGGLISFASFFGNSIITRDESTNCFVIDSDRDHSIPERVNYTSIVNKTGNEFSIESKQLGITTLKILSSGNVGIGTIYPISKLHVAGEITLPDNNFLNFNEISGHTAIKRNSFGNRLEFHTNSALRMFISDEGNIGIGTETLLHSPSSKLEVAGNIGSYGFRVKQGKPDGYPLSNSSSNGYAFGDDGDTGMFSPSSVGLPANELLGVVAFYCNNTETARTYLSSGYTNFVIGASASSKHYERTTLSIADSNNGGIIELVDGSNQSSLIYRDAFTNSLWLKGNNYNAGVVLSANGTGNITMGVSSNSSALKVNNTGIVDIPKVNSDTITTKSSRITESIYLPVSSLFMTENAYLTLNTPSYLFFDTNGTTRTVVLPTITTTETGLSFTIKNVSTLNHNIIVSAVGNGTITTVARDAHVHVVYTGISWQLI